MIFRQVIQEDLGCASYLVGDEEAGVTAVVDPRLDVDAYLELAERFGARITDVIETHTHADHVSGHGRLAELTGARIHINPEAAPAYEYVPMPDGAEVALGDVVIRAVHLPGHRPEHTVLEVIDTTRASEPWALLTGDSLLVGDVARPDLAVEKKEGAALMFDGLSALLDRLAPETELWPGHIGGSACGSAGIDLKTTSTLGYERAHSPLLTLGKDEFVGRILGELGEQPANFEAIVELNRGSLVGAGEPPRVLSTEAAQAELEAGAMPVDIRDVADFDAGHASGSVSVPAAKVGFASALARVLGPSASAILIGDDADTAGAAVRLAEAAGVSGLAVLDGGYAAWKAAGLGTEATETQTADWVAAQIRDGGVQVIDVRSAGAFSRSAIPGSVHADYQDLSRVPEGIDVSEPVAVICGTGYKSGIGASLLQRAGAERVIHVVGGGVGDVLES
jgi:hydroxyacylglutathione hydrolase